MHNLQHHYVDELKDIYNAEKQLLRALPRMAKAAHSPELQTAFKDHLKKTEQHVQRLEKIFNDLGRPASGKKCEGMTGLILEASELFDKDAAPEVMDAALIGAAQKVEHYEMATYGTLRNFARHLGEERAADLLQQTLDEEGEADKLLTRIAESGINKQASEQLD
jgi:ferritin-like metal-binding protein YciE